MNAPYDGDRGHGAGNDPAGRVPPPQSGPYAHQSPYGPEPHQQDPYLGDPRDISYSQLPYVQDPYMQDPYVTGSFTPYPYTAQDPYAGRQDSYGHDPLTDPLTDPLYDQGQGGYHAPQSGGYQQPYQQQPAPPQGHDPRLWSPEAAAPQGPAPQQYGGDIEATQYLGTGPQAGYDAGDQQQPDAFAHLFRDQQPYEPQRPQQPPAGYAPAGPPQGQAPVSEPPGPVPAQPAAPAGAAAAVAEPETAEPEQKRSGGRAANLLKSSAVMAAGTLVSRLTGFVRQVVIVAAIGAGTLGDTYAVAYQLPAMIYFLTVGGGLNSVFVPQLVRSMKEDEDGGDAYANRLLTLVMVVLAALVAVSVFAAPTLVRMLSPSIAGDPHANEVAVAFARYCLPTIFFMGVHVVVGQILNARGSFGSMMWTPVLNNIVVIASFGLFIWVFGTFSSSKMAPASVTPEGVRLLGVGTLLGLTVQALAMFPYLRAAGFRFRPRFDWRGHGLGKAAKLAKWTVLFVLANQAGNVVVTRLATAAGTKANNQGFPGTGLLGYQSAQLIWGMPQAIITVSVMAALLPRISRAAHDGDTGAVRDDISQGLRTSAVAIVPLALGFVALGIPMCTLLFGSSGTEQARSMGYILMAFGLGLIPFSVQYVVLRGFYAYEDTRTPFYNTVIVAAVNAAASGLCYLILPARWAVAGMAASYGLAYAIGVGVAWRRLRKLLGGDLDGRHVIRTYTRLVGAGIPATLIGGAAAYVITGALGAGMAGSLAALAGGGLVLIAVFYIAAKRMRIEELTAMVGMVRGRLGR